MPRLNRFSPGSPWAHCQARGPGLGLYFVRRVRSHDATICPLSGRALRSRSGNAPFRWPLSGSSRHFLYSSPLWTTPVLAFARTCVSPELWVSTLLARVAACPSVRSSSAAVSRDAAPAWSLSADRRRSHSPARGRTGASPRRFEFGPPPPPPDRPSLTFFPSHVSALLLLT